MKLTLRPAVMDDLPSIMEIERDGFPGMEASEQTMEHRIKLCNDRPPYFFWVAETEEEEGEKDMVANIIAQPTHKEVDECTSWEASTDDGKMTGTFDRTGHNLYIVSLGGPHAPPGAADLLVNRCLLLWLSIPGAFIFNSRMPGFQKAQRQESNLTAWEYYARRHVVDGVDLGPRDPEMQYYWQMFGQEEPYRCNVNGFKPDIKSGGHAALFALFQKQKALGAMAHHLYMDGRQAATNELTPAADTAA